MATKKRLIDANDVYSLFDINGMARLHVGDIDMIPRIDAVEVKHGRWVNSYINGYGHPCHFCSECGFKASYQDKNYCPNCGAKMDGDGNG